MSRPRRLWWSFGWVLRWSVSCAIRVVRIAICTSAEPVSFVERACSWMIVRLSSWVRVMVEDQGYQRRRVSDRAQAPPIRGPGTPPTASAEGVVGDQLEGPLDVLPDRRHQRVDRVVAHLL